METKTCPSCGTEVPMAANRCRECFHDFDAAPKRTNGSPIALLVSLAGMAIVGGVAFWYLSQQPVDTRILVDGPSRSVQWVTKYQDDQLKTDRLSFDDIQSLEYVVTSTGEHEILAITRTGERKIIEQHPDKSLQLKAEKYAQMMDKPLETIDRTFGFQK